MGGGKGLCDGGGDIGNPWAGLGFAISFSQDIGLPGEKVVPNSPYN